MQTEEIIHNLLVNIGENPDRPELLKTPARVAKFWQYVSQGYRVDVSAMLKESIIHEDYNQMIIVKDIDFF
ncbi:MAG: GTP cyclohydrolase I, partial [Candidatus Marinimicrobia bacterium]|nr:GTP cyclohydrolase I [Candidatus Neomarinimicrobiota bacterium]